MELPVSLRHLALHSCGFRLLPENYLASMRKLSNLKTLDLCRYDDLDLSLLNVNLAKLKIMDCSIKSLPRGLLHLEIIHSRECRCDKCYDQLQVCFTQLVNLYTLSVTCHNMNILPIIARLHNLRKLQLKDCFGLKALPPTLYNLVKLCTLNLSGTRIKSLPDSITKLPNLRHLILPKCFKCKSLPQYYVNKVMVSIDDTNDMYYEHEGYYNSCYDSNEVNEIMPGCMEGGDEVVLQESRYDITIKQTSPHRPLNPLPDSTQVHEGSHFSCSTDPIDNAFSSSLNLDMRILSTVNEDWVVPLAPNNFSNYNEMNGHHFASKIRQVHTDPKEFEVGENSLQRLSSLQHQEMGTYVDDLAAKPNSSVLETTFAETNQQAFQNRRTDAINLDIERRIASCDSINSVHDGSNKNALENEQNKTQKIEISRETILALLSQNMRLVDAAEKLGVSRSTMKRNLKKHKITWQSNKKRKQHQDAKNKKQNTKSSYGRNFSALDLVDPANLAGHDHMVGHLDGTNQLTLSDHLPSEVDAVHDSIPDVLGRIVEEPPVETQCHVDGHQQVEEHSNGAEESTLLNTVQPNGSSSTFVVKATFDGDTVRVGNFSLSFSAEQLKEEVGKKLGLEVGKFKMKYLDEDKEWILLSSISDLEHALRLSRSSGSNVVRLSVISKT